MPPTGTWWASRAAWSGNRVGPWPLIWTNYTPRAASRPRRGTSFARWAPHSIRPLREANHMAGDPYLVDQAPWRNTALPAMLWGIEAHAALPIALWLVHIRWSTFWLVVGIVAGLTVIRYFGLDARSAYRLVGTFLIRALAGGHVRAAPAYWERRS